jgi:hypothetical protein
MRTRVIVEISIFVKIRMVVSAALFSVVACGGPAVDMDAPGNAADEAFIDEQAANEEPLLRYTQDTSKWVYQGVLPKLDDVSIVVSLQGRTAHVSGLLPVGFTGTIPFYAVKETVGSRTRLHVVYPIATADPSSFVSPGVKSRDPQPGNYKVCGGSKAEPTAISPFGGFPFIEYVCNFTDRDGRVRSGIAFHGPITTARYEGTSYWSLLRGPVSHACNRMLGEHVLELARITGFDKGQMGTPVKVIAGVDTFQGKAVDVDYAATRFERPANATVFKTWQAVRATGANGVVLDFPRWACEASRCASMPENRLDAVTGLPKK